MNTDEILRQIDAEISRLTQARDLVANAASHRTNPRLRRGSTASPKPKTAAKKRTISAEGRARIAAAQRRRWAKQKRTKE